MEEQEIHTVSTSRELKRSSTDSSDSHTLEEIPYRSTKRTKYDESESSENTNTTYTTDTSSPKLSISPIEEQTSLWTEDVLNNLQITSKVTDLLKITDIFSEHILPSLAPLARFNVQQIGETVPISQSALTRTVSKCLERLAISQSPLGMLDVEDISDIAVSSAYSLMFERAGKTLQRKICSWMPAGGKFDPIENWFNQMFYLHGQRFSQQLINICLVQKTEAPLESMFVRLFEEFAGMCGLLTLGQRKNGVSMKINNTKVTSVSDIIIPYFADSDDDALNILAVCEVKHHFIHHHSGSPRETRLQEVKKMKKEKTTKHLDDKLLGQHGGELLLNLPLTKRNSIAGIIIQRTNVTFSYFSCSPERLEKIQTGRNSKSSEIIYSRPYNFLKAEDRLELMRALITLSVIQLNPYISTTE